MQGIPKKSSRQAMADWLNATANHRRRTPPTEHSARVAPELFGTHVRRSQKVKPLGDD